MTDNNDDMEPMESDNPYYATEKPGNRSEGRMGRTGKCVRCDKTVNTSPSFPRGYKPLSFNQEAGSLPMCNSCFEKVKERDIYD